MIYLYHELFEIFWLVFFIELASKLIIILADHSASAMSSLIIGLTTIDLSSILYILIIDLTVDLII